MKIVACSPFYNENLIARIKIEESRDWIDELHITECNRSFKYTRKPYSFAYSADPLVRYHKINGNKVFRKPHWSLSLRPLSINYNNYPWDNDGIQRNLASSFIEVQDDDIVILSDLDEIIDKRYSDKVIYEAKKHGIITIKLRFSLFYFNLFSKNWGGPPDYSYRTFIMTGRYFNTMRITSDQLRKQGEHGKLLGDVHCLEEFVGFHHSWLGDATFVSGKLKAYAHEAADHDPAVFLRNGNVNLEYVKKCLQSNKSIFGKTHELSVNNECNMLEAVDKLRNEHAYKNFFL